jgi:twitching motility two-component system response regulator PilH
MRQEGTVLKKQILIVDDEDEVREFVSAVLEENGFVPQTAKNGEEAMDIVRKNRPDLIILDILMPKEGGIRMYRELKTTDFLKEIPVVIYSGIAKRTFLRTQAIRTEFGGQSVDEPEGYVEKPSKPEHLAEVVKEILD